MENAIEKLNSKSINAANEMTELESTCNIITKANACAVLKLVDIESGNLNYLIISYQMHYSGWVGDLW
jgi:hypothetical protein